MRPPTTRSEIPTPALLIDVPAMQRNIARMAAFFSEGDCRLRPHFKAHKTPEIAKRQLAAGSVTGITCATVAEAEIAAEFCDDILIANEVIGPDKCARVVALVRATGLHDRRRITIAIDSQEGLAQIAAAATGDHGGPRRGEHDREHPFDIGVLVDLNVGQNRCGVAPGRDALELAKRVVRTAGVTLRGVMGYEGHLQPIADRAERQRLARAAMDQLVGTAQMFRDSGFPCDVVSGGGTGTYDISGRVPGVTEIQAGSYVMMDTDYARLDLPFEHAFSVLGTVVSRPADGYCVADCGHKSTTKDHGLPGVKGIAGASVRALNDEHAVIDLPPGNGIRIGDRLELLPSHTDPTINLHDAFYAMEGERVIGVWPIAARGYRNR
jgi:D-serine deaminase-like pyridoxal phosphate-dependent protein